MGLLEVLNQKVIAGPRMNSDRWRRIQLLFEQAIAQPTSARESFLEQACADDGDLLYEVRELLRHDAMVRRTVESLVAEAADEMLADTGAERIGQRYGAWEIISHIADGGMGAVYRVRRADGAFDQQAALKLLAPALFRQHGRRRLEAERQILAGLSHQNIARLLDGGTGADGVPFLVMEYVDGTPIDLHCNAEGLDTKARLRLFLQVCDAVDYAHRNLVVHRDIKPSNVLVGTDGVPKLLDFGISKLLDQPNNTVTHADQRVFTPAHASPEQINGTAVTTATDVYALGVLLYELLAGSLPFVSAGRSSAQIAQDILLTEPVRPSLSVARSSARLEAAHRRGDSLTAEKLRRELDGDLDNIVLMALRKEPTRRYASVQALADDVRAVLEHRPVTARADTLAYRTGKFVRRHRVGVTLSVTALVMGAGMLAYHTARLEDERDRATAAQREAESAAATSEQTARFLSELFEDADPERSGRPDLSARDVLDQGRARLAQAGALPPKVRARLLLSIGRGYVAVDRLDDASAALKGALALMPSPVVDPESTALRCDILGELGQLYVLSGDEEDAQQAFADCALLAPSTTEFRRLVAVHVQGQAQLADSRGEKTRAVTLARQAVQIVADDPALERVSLKARSSLVTTLWNAGMVQSAMKEMADLAQWAEAALGVNNPLYPRILSRQSFLYRSFGRSEEAMATAQRAMDLARQQWPEGSTGLAEAKSDLAEALLDTRRHNEAITLYEQAHRTLLSVRGPTAPRTLHVAAELVVAYRHVGRRAEAVQAARDSLAASAQDRLGAQSSIQRSQLLRLLGYLMEDERRWDQAYRYYREAIDALPAKARQHSTQALKVREDIAWALGRLGRFQEGQQEYLALVEHGRQQLAIEYPPGFGRLLETYAEWLEMMKQPAMATQWREQWKAQIEAGNQYIEMLRTREREVAEATRSADQSPK